VIGDAAGGGGGFELGADAVELGKDAAEEVIGSAGGGVEGDGAEFLQGAAVGEDYGVNGAAGGDGDAVNNGEFGLAEGLEDWDEGDIDLAGGELIGETGWMLENDLALIGDDEGFGV